MKVTGKVPPGVMDAVTQPDGRTIYVPPAFLTRIEGVLGRVVKTVKRPAILPADRYNTTRALLCSQAWAMPDYGWWTQLQPHFPRAFEAQGDRARAKAHARLVAETRALADRLDEIRSGQ